MKKVFLVPNIITAFGLACGLFVIFKAMLPIEKDLNAALRMYALILLLAGFADLLDGIFARVFHAESEFGFMFDSLADAISFGVAPSVLFLRSIDLKPNTLMGFLVIASCMIYTICGILRLVRFNVKSAESKNDRHAALMFKKTFTGFPIPASAAVAVSMNLFLTSELCLEYFPVSMQLRTIIMMITIVLLGYFMISRWKFPTIKTVRIQVLPIYLVFISALLAIFVLFGLIYFLSELFLLFSLGYLLLGLMLTLIRKWKKKDSSVLSDFDLHDENQE